jgi:hypothetical protein
VRNAYKHKTYENPFRSLDPYVGKAKPPSSSGPNLDQAPEHFEGEG